MNRIRSGGLNGRKQFFGVLMNMIYRIGHQADGRWGQGAGDAACLRRECADRD